MENKKLEELLVDYFMKFHEVLENDKSLCYVCEADNFSQELAEKILDLFDENKN
ncbi:hypothetical protein IT568_00205 [bacterium]|jgi:hypothetical protein|nr:hypothetical protein [bacterium]